MERSFVSHTTPNRTNDRKRRYWLVICLTATVWTAAWLASWIPDSVFGSGLAGLLGSIFFQATKTDSP
ncbi:MAG: hypothetical protein J0L84_04030 [Verrucomicrobia bacterium]|nr:hypothetical protein [Verrucomicrobiota bacterium]